MLAMKLQLLPQMYMNRLHIKKIHFFADGIRAFTIVLHGCSITRNAANAARNDKTRQESQSLITSAMENVGKRYQLKMRTSKIIGWTRYTDKPSFASGEKNGISKKLSPGSVRS